MADQQTTDDDYQLMQRIASGDEQALGALFDRYGNLLFTLCRRIVGDAHEAEDVLLDVFWELWNNPTRYRSPRSAPRTYLILLARSRAIDRHRSRIAHQRQDVRDSIPAASHFPCESELLGPEGSAVNNEQRRLVVEAVRGLDAAERSAIGLAFFDGLTHREIAERLGVPLGTVKTRIRLGIARLRGVLRKFFSAGEEP